MTLKNFNVFGKVIVGRKKINIAYSATNQKGKQTPITITSEEEIPEIKDGSTGEFLFGMSVKPSEYEISYYVINPIADIDVETLATVKKYMDLAADSIRKFEQLSS
jgi:hypothetical protein